MSLCCPCDGCECVSVVPVVDVSVSVFCPCGRCVSLCCPCGGCECVSVLSLWWV